MDVPPALQLMVDATNREDSTAFLTAFSADAVLDDFGRVFAGQDAIAGWNAQENIGTHNRILVTGVREHDGQFEATVRVTGDGYNGDGTFIVRTAGGRIRELIIRP